MELWLDAASVRHGTLESHPADRVLLAAGDAIPEWVDSPLFACEDGRILDASTNSVGVHVDVDDSEGQDAAKSMVGMVSWIVLTTGDWQMIPLENLVAASQGTGTKLVARIDSNQAIRGAAFALETGVDALLLPANNPEILGPEAKLSLLNVWQHVLKVRKLWRMIRASSRRKSPRFKTVVLAIAPV
ncbi:MAG: hypothetical protein Ct9H90mP16_00220 [Candidatus Poseidoniales archaeon]|nr:MAG: hypothetical protein Ct9H90mP16_00220 [Candidatus Poseidoniales archaeon]